MSASEQRAAPAGIGLRDFAATLLRDTHEAVLEAQLEQERRVAALLELDASAAEHGYPVEVADHDVEAELLRLFPSAGAERAIRPGQPYRPESAEAPESPPIGSRTGHVMRCGEDWEATEGRGVISAAGYRRIVQQVRARLSVQRQRDLRSVLRRGVPRVIVDAGRLEAKLTFAVAPGDLDDGRAAQPPPTIRRLSMRVQPADPRQPEMARAGSLVGGLEIQFKTVFD